MTLIFLIAFEEAKDGANAEENEDGEAGDRNGQGSDLLVDRTEMRVHIVRVGAELVMHVSSEIVDLVLQVLNIAEQVGLAARRITSLRELAHLAWHEVFPDVGDRLVHFLL